MRIWLAPMCLVIATTANLGFDFPRPAHAGPSALDCAKFIDAGNKHIRVGDKHKARAVYADCMRRLQAHHQDEYGKAMKRAKRRDETKKLVEDMLEVMGSSGGGHGRQGKHGKKSHFVPGIF